MSRHADRRSEDPERRHDFFGASLDGRFDVIALRGAAAGDELGGARCYESRG